MTGYLLNQLRKPSKAVGRLFLKNMNQRHSAVTDWGLRQVQIGEQRAIIDVGCGGGRTLAKLAGLAPNARIVGVDFAAGSIAESRAHNAALIAAGRVEVIEASVSQLPGPAGQFDLATAVETHYYWPDLVANLAEIRRVLRPGGTLVLIAETYRDMRLGWVIALTMALLRASVLTAEEHQQRLLQAGFTDIQVTTDRSRGWICAVARAP
jgi:ubiquinone/menaquinone biosynthesis C-methylase UbiE